MRPKLIVLISLMVLIGVSGFLYFNYLRGLDENQDYIQHKDNAKTQPLEIEVEEGTELQTEGDNATAEEPETQIEHSIEDFEFTALPTLEEYIGSITPLGWLGASTRGSPDVAHPLANERHHIIFNNNFSEGIPILAPGSGFIEWVSLSPSHEWGFTIIVNETLSYYLDHIGYLNQTLLDQLMQLDFYAPNQIYVNKRIRVNAGQVMGFTNTTNFFDWGVVDEGVVNGIANRSHYTWKRHMHGVPAFEYASDELKALLKQYYGLWDQRQNRRHQQVGDPIGGCVRNDINGTLQGIWFYDHEHDDTWGKKIALFSPYSMNRTNHQIRLSIPEISIYGNWQNMTLESAGKLNLKPYLVNRETGIVEYTLNSSFGIGDEGLLLVQLIDDSHIRIETFEGVYSMPETAEFTEKSVILYR